MFIQSRCLYVVGYERQKPSQIFSSLSRLNLIEKLFSDYEEDEILSFLEILPDQTIFSKTVARSLSDAVAYNISIPFFSSHIKMPIKVGEYIWVYPYGSLNNISQLSIDSYWLSRVHGLDFTEDANYTFNDRDISVDTISRNINKDVQKEKQSSKQSKFKIDYKKFVNEREDSFVKPNIGFGKNTFELDDTEALSLSFSLLDYPNNSIPKVSSPSEDLILQGSNNTVLKMTTNNYNNSFLERNRDGKGEIVLSSGIGSEISSISDIMTGDFVNELGEVIKDSLYTITVPENLNYSPSLYHAEEGFVENLKHGKLYSYASYDDDNNAQGLNSPADDASRLFISESANYNFYYNKNFDENINLCLVDEILQETENPSNIREDSKKFKLLNFTHTDRLITNFSETPTIGLYSSQLSFYSRIGDGNIQLSKEYYSSHAGKNLEATLKISSDGDAYLDANRIFIGSANLEKRKGTFQNGTGTIVSLGHSNESQSLVLGEQLKEFMLEIMDVNREDMHLTKQLFEDTLGSIKDINATVNTELVTGLSNYTFALSSGLSSASSALASAGLASAIPAIAQVYTDLTSLVTILTDISNRTTSFLALIENTLEQKIEATKIKREEEVSLRLDQIQKSIDKILSKVSKTS